MHLRNLRSILLTAAVSSMAVLAQPNATVDTPYQVRYASNLNIGDSVINITNAGANGAGLSAGTSASVTGSICANVYAFSPDEQMISCCSCPVTPNGLRSLSVQQDLINNTLTPAVPTSIVIKLVASTPAFGSCANTAAMVRLPGGPDPGGIPRTTSGMLAWGTTLHTAPGGGTYGTETPFLPATLSASELNRLTQLCTFILANGSGFGTCNSCRLGGLGGNRL